MDTSLHRASTKDVEEQPEWISAGKWIPANVSVRIDPTLQPDRIALDVPADRRIVVAEVVVVFIPSGQRPSVTNDRHS